MLEHADGGGAAGAIDAPARMLERPRQVESLDAGYGVLRQIRCRAMTAGLIEIGRNTVYIAAHHAVRHMARMVERRDDRALDDIIAGEVFDELAVRGEAAIAHLFRDLVPTCSAPILEIVGCEGNAVEHAAARRHAARIVDAFVAT